MGATKRGPASVPAREDQNCCAACHRIFSSHSKPRWAFTSDGRHAGRVHTSCEHGWPGHVLFGAEDNATEAHFWAWIRYFRSGRQSEAESDVLSHLMLSPDDPWGQQQEDGLLWLSEGVKSPRSPEQIAAIKSAYFALVREFFAWRGSL